jgi:hypothetical protein
MVDHQNPYLTRPTSSFRIKSYARYLRSTPSKVDWKLISKADVKLLVKFSCSNFVNMLLSINNIVNPFYLFCKIVKCN